MGTRVSGQETMDVFINDLVATFQLASPTILYDNDDEIPEICYEAQWVLCLSSSQHERDLKELQDNPKSNRESGNEGVHIYKTTYCCNTNTGCPKVRGFFDTPLNSGPA